MLATYHRLEEEIQHMTKPASSSTSTELNGDTKVTISQSKKKRLRDHHFPSAFQVINPEKTGKSSGSDQEGDDQQLKDHHIFSKTRNKGSWQYSASPLGQVQINRDERWSRMKTPLQKNEAIPSPVFQKELKRRLEEPLGILIGWLKMNSLCLEEAVNRRGPKKWVRKWMIPSQSGWISFKDSRINPWKKNCLKEPRQEGLKPLLG